MNRAKKQENHHEPGLSPYESWKFILEPHPSFATASREGRASVAAAEDWFVAVLVAVELVVLFGPAWALALLLVLLLLLGCAIMEKPIW